MVHHARALEEVAKGQGSGFQKWRSPFKALLNEITPSKTLAWQVRRRCMPSLFLAEKALLELDSLAILRYPCPCHSPVSLSFSGILIIVRYPYPGAFSGILVLAHFSVSLSWRILRYPYPGAFSGVLVIFRYPYPGAFSGILIVLRYPYHSPVSLSWRGLRYPCLGAPCPMPAFPGPNHAIQSMHAAVAALWLPEQHTRALSSVCSFKARSSVGVTLLQQWP